MGANHRPGRQRPRRGTAAAPSGRIVLSPGMVRSVKPVDEGAGFTEENGEEPPFDAEDYEEEDAEGDDADDKHYEDDDDADGDSEAEDSSERSETGEQEDEPSAVASKDENGPPHKAPSPRHLKSKSA